MTDRNWKLLVATVMALLLLLLIAVTAQQSTELYIPIGKSPGLSKEGKTVMGTVTHVSDRLMTTSNRVFQIIGINKRFVRLGENTQIYLDRSAVKGTNSYGKPSDIKTNCYVEAWAPTNHIANWFKIAVP
jgi:hypothetical protein